MKKNIQLDTDTGKLEATDLADNNGYTVFPVWAEEAGGLVNNNRQWSFGNGSIGNVNIVLPIDCELFAVSFDAEVVGTSVTMNIMKNDVLDFTTKAFTGKDFELLATATSFSAGDCIGFQTGTETGTFSDARVCAWFRVLSSAIAGDHFSGDYNDLVNLPIIPIAPVDSVNGQTGVVVLAAADVGLGNVDNTSDVDKPVSTAQQAALDLKISSSLPSRDHRIVRYDGVAGDVQDSEITITDDYRMGLGITTPIADIQVGDPFRNNLGSLNRVDTEIAQYTGTTTTIGSATLGLYEAVTLGVTGIYGFRVRYDGSSNDFEIVSVDNSVETVVFGIDRSSQKATYYVDLYSDSKQAKEFADPTDAQDLATKNYVDVLYTQRAIAEVTDTTTNISYNTFTDAPVFGDVVYLNDKGLFSESTTQMTVDIDGYVEVSLNISLRSTVQRNSTQGQLAINGVLVPYAKANTGYIRSVSGHNESSLHLSRVHLKVSSGDIISFQTQNEATTNDTATFNGGQVFIEQVVTL